MSQARGEDEVMISPLPDFGMPIPMEHPWTAGFLDPLIVEPLDDGVNWRLMEPFHYETEIIMMPYGPLVIDMEVGEISDFASTPKFMWPILNPTGPWGKPAWVHDHLFRTKGLATFEQANLVFQEALYLLRAHIDPVRRYLLYHGVEYFGRSSYQGGL